MIYHFTLRFACIVDTVASTVHSTVDTTKNAAASVVDKGVSFVGGAKGINDVIIIINKNDFLASLCLNSFQYPIIHTFVTVPWLHGLGCM